MRVGCREKLDPHLYLMFCSLCLEFDSQSRLGRAGWGDEGMHTTEHREERTSQDTKSRYNGTSGGRW